MHVTSPLQRLFRLWKFQLGFSRTILAAKLHGSKLLHFYRIFIFLENFSFFFCFLFIILHIWKMIRSPQKWGLLPETIWEKRSERKDGFRRVSETAFKIVSNPLSEYCFPALKFRATKNAKPALFGASESQSRPKFRLWNSNFEARREFSKNVFSERNSWSLLAEFMLDEYHRGEFSVLEPLF